MVEMTAFLTLLQRKTGMGVECKLNNHEWQRATQGYMYCKNCFKWEDNEQNCFGKYEGGHEECSVCDEAGECKKTTEKDYR